ncbi:nudix hydrolase 19, chloroplastic isoform X2 [Vigna angularis]|uniref:nudix hydrolase 19, chloroplastic isoform X2 n=1 Tax=Phaseolus angularis TaxID=3914 RepID=UPI0022B5207A|nr:nudix hydrolase 19, chloroplastic isoform X2 [Vigna angularis]
MLKLLNLLPSSSSKLFSRYILSLSTKLPPPLTRPFSHHPATTTMSINLRTHAFAGNPLRSRTPNRVEPFSPAAAHETLKTRIAETAGESVSVNLKVLPFRNGRPLASSGSSDTWRLAWLGLEEVKRLLGANLSADSFVYLGYDADEDSVYWAIDLSRESSLVAEFGAMKLCFVELRTLMVATDWVDLKAMGSLAIAGHARALLEWYNISRFCGHCGEKTVPMEAGRRKQCSNESCKKRIYPRVDPVVIMLVIDSDNDRALLSKQSRFVPRMWSCLAGFIEDFQMQTSKVGPNSMPCQLMVGFFAYAKSLEINVDKEELEDAQWHSREEVRRALTFTEYKKAQQTAAAKVEQMCKGVEKTHSLSTEFNVESGELAPMFVPGPFAIAHHLISSWAFPDKDINGIECRSKQPSGSMSNLLSRAEV